MIRIPKEDTPTWSVLVAWNSDLFVIHHLTDPKDGDPSFSQTAGTTTTRQNLKLLILARFFDGVKKEINDRSAWYGHR